MRLTLNVLIVDMRIVFSAWRTGAVVSALEEECQGAVVSALEEECQGAVVSALEEECQGTVMCRCGGRVSRRGDASAVVEKQWFVDG